MPEQNTEKPSESSQQESSTEEHPRVITGADGVTESERYLKSLCDKSFLSMWSYPGIFRDQGRENGKGDGKEVCDLLVVFENHVIIFSDKHCEFKDSGNLELDWGRWFKKTVLKSAEQVWGAERWIRTYPTRLFLDKQCGVPFPLVLPNAEDALFHLIVVAHDASRRCRERMGGSGSLMLDSSLVGFDGHRPFTIGQVKQDKPYVHVFDDTTLDIVLKTLDTVSDFVLYLEKKERLMSGETHILATGEEELLAEYLSKINAEGQHDFIFPETADNVFLPEDHWEHFLASDERKAQVEANKISYAWDDLVETFLGHAMGGTQYWASDPNLTEQEKSFRWLARENRTRRRMLANAFVSLIQTTPSDHRASRVIKPSAPGDPYFIFLLLPHYPSVPEGDYREGRRRLLGVYCSVLRLQFPDAQDIVGIATESGRGDCGSEDFLYFDGREWNDELAEEARGLQRELGIFRNTKVFVGKEKEYPVGPPRALEDSYISRNASCPCGSGKRFKRCCGKELVKKNKRR